jgi:hypothetical protein
VERIGRNIYYIGEQLKGKQLVRQRTVIPTQRMHTPEPMLTNNSTPLPVLADNNTTISQSPTWPRLTMRPKRDERENTCRHTQTKYEQKIS